MALNTYRDLSTGTMDLTAGFQFEFTCADQDGDRQVSVELPTDPDRINEMNQNPEEFVALFRKACPTY